MGAPFKLPAHHDEEVRREYVRKDRVVTNAVDEMRRVLVRAIDSIVDDFEKTGKYAEPALGSMDTVSEQFYRSVLKAAAVSVEGGRSKPPGMKRLMGAPPKMPKSVASLNSLFRNKRYWARVMKRAKALSSSLRKQYLRRLRFQFGKILPLIESGELAIGDVKKKMMTAWETTKPRVETIFRTETTNYFAQTQVAFFDGDDDIIGFLFDSVKDQARTEICRSRHGLVYKPGTKALRENTPACHYNCRSHLIALANTAFNRKLVGDRSRDPALVSVVPLPRGWRK